MKKAYQTIKNSWFGIVFCAFVLMTLGTAIFEIIEQAMLETWLEAHPVANTAYMYVSFIGIWIVFILFYLKSKKNRPLLPLLGHGMKGNTVPMLVLGIVLGFVMNGACALAAYLHGDFTLTPAKYSIPAVLLIFVTVFIQSSAEELVCRNFLYQRFMWKYNNTVIAIVGNAVVFALLHIFNPGLTVLSMVNLVLCGFVFSLAMWATDSIWISFGMHAMWNFTQNILLGLPNSGRIVPYSVLTLAGETHESYAYSTTFGLEGSLLCTGIYVLTALIFYCIGKKRGR